MPIISMALLVYLEQNLHFHFFLCESDVAQ